MVSNQNSDFVLDASAALAWCFKDEASGAAWSLLDRMKQGAKAYVPNLWWLEVANVLLMAQRRNRISQTNLNILFDFLSTLRIETDNERGMKVAHDSILLAREESLSAYDATYLVLAKKKSLPLATKDRALLKAAKNISVDLIEV
ncbi:MAG: type II toxin-antitoxin system VapC family toxin [Candidatus Caenarcaniphilales bacterium]|nr:type II toxin-antitoxin system VapC family toxin [Candidatus Caenarcaniphilales bacterium]